MVGSPANPPARNDQPQVHRLTGPPRTGRPCPTPRRRRRPPIPPDCAAPPAPTPPTWTGLLRTCRGRQPTGMEEAWTVGLTQLSASYWGQCRPPAGTASRNCHLGPGATVSIMNRVRTLSWSPLCRFLRPIRGLRRLRFTAVPPLTWQFAEAEPVGTEGVESPTGSVPAGHRRSHGHVSAGQSLFLSAPVYTACPPFTPPPLDSHLHPICSPFAPTAGAWR